jgi:hypothetical protein
MAPAPGAVGAISCMRRMPPMHPYLLRRPHLEQQLACVGDLDCRHVLAAAVDGRHRATAVGVEVAQQTRLGVDVDLWGGGGVGVGWGGVGWGGVGWGGTYLQV